MRKLFAMWQHGAVVGVIYAFGVFMWFIGCIALAFLLNAGLGLFGSAIDDDRVTHFVLWWGWVVWVPLGIGYAAHYASTDSPQGGIPGSHQGEA